MESYLRISRVARKTSVITCLGSAKDSSIGRCTADELELGLTAKWMLYGQSKLANVLYASQLSEHYPNLTVTAIHPGLIPTGLIDHMGMIDRSVVKLATLKLHRISLQEGAYNTLWAATSADKNALQSGGVFEPVGKPVSPTRQSADKTLAKELWDWTEKELAAYS